MGLPSFTLKEISEAVPAFMGIGSGAFRKLAPPDTKFWILGATLTVAAAYTAARLLLAQNVVPISPGAGMVAGLVLLLLGIPALFWYIRGRQERTITYVKEIKMAGTEAEYRPDVIADPQNARKSRDELLLDAAGRVEDIWTAEALRKSRGILAFRYVLTCFCSPSGSILAWTLTTLPKWIRPSPT